MSPLRLLEPALNQIYGNTGVRTLEAQAGQMAGFAAWLGGASLLLLLGKTVGSAQKDMVNQVLELATPREMPLRIPMTGNRRG